MNTIELMVHDFLHHYISYVHNNIEVYIFTEKPLLDPSLKETHTLLPFMSMIFLEEFNYTRHLMNLLIKKNAHHPIALHLQFIDIADNIYHILRLGLGEIL